MARQCRTLVEGLDCNLTDNRSTVKHMFLLGDFYWHSRVHIRSLLLCGLSISICSLRSDHYTPFHISPDDHAYQKRQNTFDTSCQYASLRRTMQYGVRNHLVEDDICITGSC
jgi:hypothetical protein